MDPQSEVVPAGPLRWQVLAEYTKVRSEQPLICLARQILDPPHRTILFISCWILYEDRSFALHDAIPVGIFCGHHLPECELQTLRSIIYNVDYVRLNSFVQRQKPVPWRYPLLISYSRCN